MTNIPKVILLIETSRASGRSLLKGIAEYSRIHGPWAFYWEPGGLEKAWPHLKKWHANGIIMRDTEKTDAMLAYGLPTIVASHTSDLIPDIQNIWTDSPSIGKMAAEHLLDCAFKQFAYCGFDDKPWSIERCEYFKNRIEEEGCKTYIYSQPRQARMRTWENEQPIMIEWLKSLPKPIGLMACNDDRAQHVVLACKTAGLLIPEEIAVIGADNDELVCTLSDPPLSSVNINFERAGYEAARCLDQLMSGQTIPPDQQIIVNPTHVETRHSTDIMAIEDKDIATALYYIRQHAKVPLQVDDVVNATTLSRRVLEKRFRALLGRSIFNEIRRVRTDFIARMLTETNQSILQIALDLGFTGIEHIARYFKQEKGFTPLAYRKKYGHK